MTIANPHLKEQLESGHRSTEDYRLRRNATYASVSVAVTLIVTKLFAFLVTGSVAVLSSLLDSTLDLITSVMTMISVRHAAEPADEAHRYGHGKLESLAAMGQAVFIVGSAIFLFYEALGRFVRPHDIQGGSIGVAVMVLAIVLTLILVAYQKHVVKKTGSVAIDADSLHYSGDLLMNAGVIAALLLTEYFGWPYFDPIFAIGVALILLFGALKIGRSSYDILMDRELPIPDREKIYNIVLKHHDVHEIHDLRTRSTGTHVFIEFHLELDGGMTLKDAHDVTEELEVKLYNAFPKAEVLIHQEPAGIDDDRLDERIRDAEDANEE